MQSHMSKKNTLRRLAILSSAAGLCALTQAQAGSAPETPGHLIGLLNDYSPAHVNGTAVKGGPYEMRGRWSLEFQRHAHAAVSATFSAALNMETTDAGGVSQDDPTTRGAHTHHITMTGPVSYDTSICPASDPANPATRDPCRGDRLGKAGPAVRSHNKCASSRAPADCNPDHPVRTVHPTSAD
jgi:hypothetical protein